MPVVVTRPVHDVFGGHSPPHCGAELPQSFGGSTQVQPDAAVPLQILPGGQTPSHAGPVAFPHSVGGGTHSHAMVPSAFVKVLHDSPVGQSPPHVLLAGSRPHVESGAQVHALAVPGTNWHVSPGRGHGPPQAPVNGFGPQDSRPHVQSLVPGFLTHVSAGFGQAPPQLPDVVGPQGGGSQPHPVAVAVHVSPAGHVPPQALFTVSKPQAGGWQLQPSGVSRQTRPGGQAPPQMFVEPSKRHRCSQKHLVPVASITHLSPRLGQTPPQVLAVGSRPHGWGGGWHVQLSDFPAECSKGSSECSPEWSPAAGWQTPTFPAASVHELPHRHGHAPFVQPLMIRHWLDRHCRAVVHIGPADGHTQHTELLQRGSFAELQVLASAVPPDAVHDCGLLLLQTGPIQHPVLRCAAALRAQTPTASTHTPARIAGTK